RQAQDAARQQPPLLPDGQVEARPPRHAGGASRAGGSAPGHGAGHGLRAVRGDPEERPGKGRTLSVRYFSATRSSQYPGCRFAWTTARTTTSKGCSLVAACSASLDTLSRARVLRATERAE